MTYRAYQSETVQECMDLVSRVSSYDLKHCAVFGRPPYRDWLSEWNITVRRQAVLRIPIIWR